jgi:two-component system, NtrC family, response regulator GlrR
VEHSLLIIEPSDSAIRGDLDQLLRLVHAHVARRDAWTSFRPERLDSCSEGLLLANAVPEAEHEHALKFFCWLHDHPARIPILAILPCENRDSDELLQAAVGAVDDFLLWPLRPEELGQRLRRLLGPLRSPCEEAESRLIKDLGFRQMVGLDPNFLRVLNQIVLFGSSEAPALITGETGTGKEMCARMIHLMSKRRSGPFIPVDCGAVPDHLFENELFGHSRGAFTDAQSDQKGLVAIAQGGTLFLDEMDGLSAAAQAKLLRLLQENTYRPLGSEQFRSANVRVIAATNADLETQVRSKQFRQDLYFRINVLRIHLPVLRERTVDIPLLACHFVDEICQASNLPRKMFSPAALRKLQNYEWPGNVRELYNTVQRAILGTNGSQIGAAHIELPRTNSSEDTLAGDFSRAKGLAIEQFEREYVERMLHKHSGNITRASHEAGKDRRAFGRLVKKYELLRNAS